MLCGVSRCTAIVANIVITERHTVVVADDLLRQETYILETMKWIIDKQFDTRQRLQCGCSDWQAAPSSQLIQAVMPTASL